jgi:hypothetical protein
VKNGESSSSWQLAAVGAIGNEEEHNSQSKALSRGSMDGLWEVLLQLADGRLDPFAMVALQKADVRRKLALQISPAYRLEGEAGLMKDMLQLVVCIDAVGIAGGSPMSNRSRHSTSLSPPGVRKNFTGSPS